MTWWSKGPRYQHSYCIAIVAPEYFGSISTRVRPLSHNQSWKYGQLSYVNRLSPFRTTYFGLGQDFSRVILCEAHTKTTRHIWCSVCICIMVDSKHGKWDNFVVSVDLRRLLHLDLLNNLITMAYNCVSDTGPQISLVTAYGWRMWHCWQVICRSVLLYTYTAVPTEPMT